MPLSDDTPKNFRDGSGGETVPHLAVPVEDDGRGASFEPSKERKFRDTL